MKSKINFICIILGLVSVVIGMRGTVFLRNLSEEEVYTHKETWIDSTNLYLFLFIYFALPIISFILSFFGKRGFLKYIAIYGNLAVMIWHVIIPAIMMTLWVLNPVP